jgi:hypothetical protein
MRLVVGYPWASPFFYTKTVDSLLNLRHPEGVDVQFVRGTGWCPARRHISLCEKALEAKADLILIVGADQVYEPDMLERLIQRHKDGYEVVSALVPLRGHTDWQEMKPFQKMAWRIKPSSEPRIRTYHGMKRDTGMMEVIDPSAGDMQEINFIGSGVIMFEPDHLLALKKPWFGERYDTKTYQRLATMDTTFTWRLQMEAGARVWVDTTIRVDHLHIFEIDETYPERFKDWANDGVGDPAICMRSDA